MAGTRLVSSNPGLLFAFFIVLGLVEIFSGIATAEDRRSGNRAPGSFSFKCLEVGKTPLASRT
ncbi:hypothetical protein EON64_01010 [archaeon]|nr:MAG: hypothetical protein EON64_01010 [archaeon]